MFNLQLESIKAKLAAIGFAKIARNAGVDSVYGKKISALALVVGFMKMYSHRRRSLSDWAVCVTEVSGELVSKQAIDQRCKSAEVACFKEVLSQLLAHHYQNDPVDDQAWSDFDRVLVQDSTCWSMPGSVMRSFPGTVTSSGVEKATARLQVCYDVKGDCFYELEVQSYRDNDQKHAASITKLARAGDLVLRDLGYFSQQVFDHLVGRGIFFISGLHYRVALYQGGERIDVLKLCRGRKRLDIHVELGSQVRVGLRLVGKKLPTKQAARRRRKAKEDTRSTPSKAYLQWLGWTFYITNLPSERFSISHILRLYGIRWRIELIFKGFKSGLNWTWMFAERSLKYERVMITIYLMLIYMLLCWRCYRWFARSSKQLSLLKFLRWYQLNYQQILGADDLEVFRPWVEKHCRYETRKDRKNYEQKVQLCQ